MATKLEIQNMALVEISAIPSAGDSEDPDAVAAGLIYPNVLSEILKAYTWRWATVRERLQQAGTPLPEGESLYRYTWGLPTEAQAQITGVYQGTFPRPTGWEERILAQGERTGVEPGIYLLTSFPNVELEYQRDVQEENFPPLFQSALVLKLASRFALAIQGDDLIGTWYERQFQMAVQQALRVDAQSAVAARLSSFSWVESRVGLGRQPAGL